VGVLRVVDEATATELRKQLQRDDPYDKSGKPSCAWDDKKAREGKMLDRPGGAGLLPAERSGRDRIARSDQQARRV
jgi:hypothetical protein